MIPTADDLGVSRETFERLKIYSSLLQKWTPKINLVSRSTIDHLWQRHIADSLQLVKMAPDWGKWADLGSGGGFPGLVVAIASAEWPGSHRAALIESDQRKSAFLRTVLRETGISADVICERVEALAPLRADIVSARALADLDMLLGFAYRHLAPDGTALFLKGKNWKSELQKASLSWRFSYDAITSQTESQSVVLHIKGIARD